jgi:hypothetical protein
MREPNQRLLVFVVLALVLLGGALRVWAGISFPALDGYDRTPLIGAGVGAVVFVVIGVFMAPPQPTQLRFVAALVGIAVGCSLGLGVFQVANGLLDRSPTRWVPYTVAAHWHGRRRIVTLTRVGGALGTPETLWLPDASATSGTAAGTPVSVPMKRGALHSAWRPEEIRVVNPSPHA